MSGKGVAHLIGADGVSSSQRCHSPKSASEADWPSSGSRCALEALRAAPSCASWEPIVTWGRRGETSAGCRLNPPEDRYERLRERGCAVEVVGMGLAHGLE